MRSKLPKISTQNQDQKSPGDLTKQQGQDSSNQEEINGYAFQNVNPLTHHLNKENSIEYCHLRQYKFKIQLNSSLKIGWTNRKHVPLTCLNNRLQPLSINYKKETTRMTNMHALTCISSQGHISQTAITIRPRVLPISHLSHSQRPL